MKFAAKKSRSGIREQRRSERGHGKRRKTHREKDGGRSKRICGYGARSRRNQDASAIITEQYRGEMAEWLKAAVC
jgi:hypothetical protein